MDIQTLVWKIIECRNKLKDICREMYHLNLNIEMIRDPLMDGDEPFFDVEEARLQLSELEKYYKSRKTRYQVLCEVAKAREEDLKNIRIPA